MNAELLDLDGDVIEPFGCNCDLDAPCSVPECLMERDFEQRRMAVWYAHQRQLGFTPDMITVRVCA